MLSDIIPFEISISATTIAGAGLWSLALYLGFSPLGTWVMEQLNRWFNYAERSLYTSQEEFERTRRGREAQNAFYASIFSIVPFLAVGTVCNAIIEWGLGGSWVISMGILVCVGCGIYELGRWDGKQ